MAAKIAIIAMTTNNSISVNGRRDAGNDMETPKYAPHAGIAVPVFRQTVIQDYSAISGNFYHRHETSVPRFSVIYCIAVRLAGAAVVCSKQSCARSESFEKNSHRIINHRLIFDYIFIELQ